MPFSVKATYGRSGELRKLSFPTFPTYDELYQQLYRVFPISNSYYLSKILFSPDSSKASILIGREVRGAEQYNSCTAPYNTGLYPNAMLRFTVHDETYHKPPFVPAPPPPASVFNPLPARIQPEDLWASTSIVPPPPVLPTHTSTIDVDMDRIGPFIPFPAHMQPNYHQHTDAPQSEAGTGSSCCAVKEGQVQIEGIMAQFKEDLSKIIATSFSPSPSPAMQQPLPPSSFCLFKYCTSCAKIFQGPWFICETCSMVKCTGCHEASTGFCTAVMGPHKMKKDTCAACPVETPVAANAQLPTGLWSDPVSTGYNPTYPFGHSVPSAVPPPFAGAPAPAAPPSLPAVPPPPVIHNGVLCDMCDKTIEGVRHKCMDCPNYDLCTACVTSGSAERHNPFHEFIDIKEPGRVIVHTVYTGDDQRESFLPDPRRQDERSESTASPEPEPAVHYATCNLCDSRIRGVRYKCADCPDFDTCSSCFNITHEQHPSHAFVKLSNASDYVRRGNAINPMHNVSCDACKKIVYGIRYKCMHPDCPDFDLCADCEAFPIPVHPDNHPLLKMRSPSTVVPTVYRVGQTTLIEEPFSRGYMVNPNSFFDSAPSPIPPPSPMYFRSTPSPGLSYLTRPSPTVPSPVPMLMPGGLYDEQPMSAFSRVPRRSFSAAPASRFSHSPSPPPSPGRPWATPGSWPSTPDLTEELERDRERLAAIHSVTEAHRALEQRIEQSQLRWASPSAPIPVPVVTPAAESPFPSFWPTTSTDLRHLILNETESVREPTLERTLNAFSHLSVHEEAESTGQSSTVKAPASLAALLNGYESDEAEKDVLAPTVMPREPTLRANYVIDVTVPDGQIFPPGAEFIKCWQMTNSGEHDWPAETELVWVAGDRLAREQDGPSNVSIGQVKIGAQVELWTGELKAPEVPGRYVSYWRLRDGEGKLFGDSIWIDINVIEGSNEASMSSSSVMVMPGGPLSRVEIEESADGSSEASSVSSVSLISVSSEEEEWLSVPPSEDRPSYEVLYESSDSGLE